MLSEQDQKNKNALHYFLFVMIAFSKIATIIEIIFLSIYLKYYDTPLQEGQSPQSYFALSVLLYFFALRLIIFFWMIRNRTENKIRFQRFLQLITFTEDIALFFKLIGLQNNNSNNVQAELDDFNQDLLQNVEYIENDEYYYPNHYHYLNNNYNQNNNNQIPNDFYQRCKSFQNFYKIEVLQMLPFKMICISCIVGEQYLAFTTQTIFCLLTIISLGIDLHFLQTFLVIKIKYIATKFNFISEILLKETLFVVFYYIACQSVIKEISANYYISYAGLKLLIALSLIMVIGKKYSNPGLLVIILFSEVCFEHNTIGTWKEVIGQYAQKQLIRHSIVQKCILLSVYIIYLSDIEVISSYQYLVLSLLLFSISIQSIRHFYKAKYLTPEKIEIFDLYDFKQYMLLWELENNNSNLVFFKNLKLVQLFIQFESFPNKLDLIKCLLCSFGKAEIYGQRFGRVNLVNSSYSQEVVFEGSDIKYSDMKQLIRTSSILRQIKQFKIQFDQQENYLDLAQLILKQNLLMKLETIKGINQFSVLHIHNKFIDSMEVEIIKTLAFQKLISFSLTYNPQIILYDLHE